MAGGAGRGQAFATRRPRIGQGSRCLVAVVTMNQADRYLRGTRRWRASQPPKFGLALRFRTLRLHHGFTPEANTCRPPGSGQRSSTRCILGSPRYRAQIASPAHDSGSAARRAACISLGCEPVADDRWGRSITAKGHSLLAPCSWARRKPIFSAPARFPAAEIRASPAISKPAAPPRVHTRG